MKPLQREGLVVAESAEHDGRTLLFSLTDKGEATFDQAAIAWRAAQEEFETKFGHARAKTLRAELFSITG
jgi:DNA-binding MarR family transcriptional regulator